MSRDKRGRPPLSPDEPSTPVQVRLPDSLYDRAYAEASKEHVTVPELIRRALHRDLREREA